MTLYCIGRDDGWHDLHPKIFRSAEEREKWAVHEAAEEARRSIHRVAATELKCIRSDYYLLDVDEATGEYNIVTEA